LVLDAPFFKKRIQVLRTQRIWEDHSGYLLVKEAKLVDKPEKVYPVTDAIRRNGCQNGSGPTIFKEIEKEA
jgi:hypothetical protein